MIYVVANSKGGTGKTSFSLNLIPHLKPDLIIDADVHENISYFLGCGDNTIKVERANSLEDMIKFCDIENKTVLIDCGGFDVDIVGYAISQADYIITPSSDDATEQYGLVKFNDVMAEISKATGCKLVANVVLNKVHHSRSSFTEMADLIDDLEYLHLSKTVIPHSALIPKAVINGCAVTKGNLPLKFKNVVNNLV